MLLLWEILMQGSTKSKPKITLAWGPAMRTYADSRITITLQHWQRVKSALDRGSHLSHTTTYAPASRIDHILVDEHLVPVLHKCSVADDVPLNVSRHLTVHACVKVNITPRSTDSLCEPFSKICFRWNNPRQLQSYEHQVSENLAESLDASDVNTRYEHIINAVSSAAQTHVSKRQFCKFLKHYWSDSLREFHQNLRFARCVWVGQGKPRQIEYYIQVSENAYEQRHDIMKVKSLNVLLHWVS